MKSRIIRTKTGWALAVGMLCLAVAASTSAQVQTTTTTTSGTPTKQVKILSGEVVAVKGNDLFVKMDDGSIRDFKVPAGATANVDGQQLGLNDLKPGMKLLKATVTTTTPQVVTTIQTVTGKVWYVNPPLSVILTLEDGQNQEFKIPDGQKFMVDGQETDAWGLKKGMKVTATKIVETPATSTTRQTQVTGTFSADQPLLIAKGNPKPAPAAGGTKSTAESTSAAGATSTASAKLPKTGSELPLIGFLGLLSLFASVGLKLLRRV
jgi:LPXTG-motif cell wall-anchored protein